MLDIKKIADQADMIVNGYAFTKENDRYRVLNLNNPDKAAVIDNDGNVTETSMDDIELHIVRDCFYKNRRFMEEAAYA